jgi:hypothetical protein
MRPDDIGKAGSSSCRREAGDGTRSELVRAARDLSVHANALWVQPSESQSRPLGQRTKRPGDAGLVRFRRLVARLTMGCDIP